jgi:hypothetical protein
MSAPLTPSLQIAGQHGCARATGCPSLRLMLGPRPRQASTRSGAAPDHGYQGLANTMLRMGCNETNCKRWASLSQVGTALGEAILNIMDECTLCIAPKRSL